MKLYINDNSSLHNVLTGKTRVQIYKGMTITIGAAYWNLYPHYVWGPKDGAINRS